MSERINQYTEVKRKDGEWLKEDETIKPGDFYVWFDENDKPFMCRFNCPCGCPSDICLWLRDVNTPVNDNSVIASHTWIYRHNGFLISPSVWRTACCKSHFCLNQDGTVQWV